jgi:hypothetical protein
VIGFADSTVTQQTRPDLRRAAGKVHTVGHYFGDEFGYGISGGTADEQRNSVLRRRAHGTMKPLHERVWETTVSRYAGQGPTGGDALSKNRPRTEVADHVLQARQGYATATVAGFTGGGGGGGGGGTADGGSVGGGSSGRESGGPRPSPALLEAIGEAMHRANESYLDRAIAPASSLPKEVQAQIRTEVSSQLEAKVDNVLSATITVSQSGGSSGSADVDGLAVRFSALVAVGGGDDAIGSFCDAVLANAEVRKTVEPLVNLLVQYATSRLKEATGGK